MFERDLEHKLIQVRHRLVHKASVGVVWTKVSIPRARILVRRYPSPNRPVRKTLRMAGDHPKDPPGENVAVEQWLARGTSRGGIDCGIADQ